MIEQLAHRRADMTSALDKHDRHLMKSLRRLDLVDRQLDGGLVGRVKDVVDCARESEEILAVEGCRIGARELVDQDSAFGVAFALDLFDLFDQRVVGSGLATELLERLQCANGQVGLL